MRVPAAILLAMLVATPAMAIDITSGSGAVVKNGAGLAVVNGDPCAGRMVAACLDREGDRREGRSTEGIDLEPASVEPDPVDDETNNDGCTDCDQLK